MAVIWDNNFLYSSFVVVKGDIKLVSEGVDDGSADAEAGERAGARHKGDFGNIGESFAVFF